MSDGPEVRLVTVREGEGDPIVVMDFVRFSSEKTAVDLIAEARPSALQMRADPVSDLADGEWTPTLDDLAAQYATIVGAGRPPSLLVGYCSAAALAVSTARHVMSSTGVAPPVLLLAPGFPDHAHIVDELADIHRTLGAASPVPDAPPRLADLKVMALETVRHDLMAVTVENGLSGEEAELVIEQLGARYNAWLGFLVACAEDVSTWWPPDLRILTNGDALSVPRAGWPAWARTETRLVARELLLVERTTTLLDPLLDPTVPGPPEVGQHRP